MTDLNIVKKQVIIACKTNGITELETMKMFVDFFTWYYLAYQQLYGREHKHLTTESIETAIWNMFSCDEIMGGGLDTLKKMAKLYFKSKFSCKTDRSITHFACPEVLQNRIYELYL